MLNDNTNGWTALNNLDQLVTYAIWNLTAPVATLNNSVGAFMAVLNDPVTGLIPNLNCTIIGFHLNRIYTDVCVGMVTSFYQAALVIALCSCFSFLGVLWIFCLAKRILIPKAGEANPNQQQPADAGYGDPKQGY